MTPTRCRPRQTRRPDPEDPRQDEVYEEEHAELFREIDKGDFREPTKRKTRSRRPATKTRSCLTQGKAAHPCAGRPRKPGGRATRSDNPFGMLQMVSLGRASVPYIPRGRFARSVKVMSDAEPLDVVVIGAGFAGLYRCTGCASRGSLFKGSSAATGLAVPGTGTATRGRAATRRSCTTRSPSCLTSNRSGRSPSGTRPSPTSSATSKRWPAAWTCARTSPSARK